MQWRKLCCGIMMCGMLVILLQHHSGLFKVKKHSVLLLYILSEIKKWVDRTSRLI